jgi:hypothetical protein
LLTVDQYSERAYNPEIPRNKIPYRSFLQTTKIFVRHLYFARVKLVLARTHSENVPDFGLL